MNPQRIQVALLTVGLAAADLGAIQLGRTGRLAFIGLVLVGLAAASVGGFSFVAILGNRANETPQPTENSVECASHRFGLRSLMLTLVIFAVWFSAIATMYAHGNSRSYSNWDWDWDWLLAPPIKRLMLVAPLWFPFIALAFGIGRKSINWRIVIAFALLECAALVGFWSVTQ